MSKRSQFQMINRGRKGRPCWVIYFGEKYLYSTRTRSEADSFLRLLRREERAEQAENAQKGGAA